MLCFVDQTEPGITRKKLAHGWAYYDPAGQRITDRDEIDRLNKIALPPAYRDAWFCPSPHGHIQAIGYDEKGRKQYRYHLDFRSQQEADKYDRCADFGRALPKIRARVEKDLAGRRLTKDTVVAAVVRLLDLGRVRVGNDGYAKANKSFGATTLRDRHAKISGGRLKLEYVGKSGKLQQITINDRRLAHVVRRSQDLPGQRLFQYIGEDGQQHPVTSSDVNTYLREASGGAFTAKHFRTWGASTLAFDALVQSAPEGIKLKTMLAPVAAALGNTPAISRKSYVHPALIELAQGGGLKGQEKPRLPRAAKNLSPVERALIDFLDTLATPATDDREAA
jgi:DNA topoisomerase-1